MPDQKQLDRIEGKLDAAHERLSDVDVRLAKYNSELEFHVARTTQIEDELLPIVKHVEQMQGAGKLLIWASVLATIIGGISWAWSR